MRKKRKWIILIMTVCIILLVFVFFGKEKTDTIGENDTAVDTVTDGQEKEKSGIEFPYELENGKLIVNSLFQSSVENPDCGNEIEEDIASLEITNQSDEFCALAEIKVVMEDGAEISFTATNIPAGKKVWAFATDNHTIAQESICEKIECTVEFGEASLMEDQVMCSVEDTTITIQNRTVNEITDLSVYYHCLFEDAYFGGVTYIYSVKSLPEGESVTIEADDCYMGTAEVVCIKKDN